MFRFILTISIFLLFAVCKGQIAGAVVSVGKLPPPGTGSADVNTNVLLALDVNADNAYCWYGSCYTFTPGSVEVNDELIYPSGIAFDSSGNFYVSNVYNNIQYGSVMKYSPQGVLLQAFGESGITGSSIPEFDQAMAVALDSNNIIYVADSGNGRVQILNEAGTYIGEIDLATPTVNDVAIDKNNNIYTVDGNGLIQKYTNSGNSTTSSTTLVQSWSTVTGSPGKVASSVAFDSSNNVYVTFNSSQMVKEFDDNGNLMSSFSTSPVSPWGITLANDGSLYISAPGNGVVNHYSSNGTLLQSISNFEVYNPNTTAAKNYPYYQYGFSSVWGLATDISGNIWTADEANNNVATLNGNVYINSTFEDALIDITAVLQNIVSDISLNATANFGLMTYWDSGANLVVPISTTGAAAINTVLPTIGTEISPCCTQTHDALMDAAQSYFTGASSPINHSETCQNNIIVIISDAPDEFDSTSDSVAANLYSNYGIKTFVLALPSAAFGDGVDPVDISLSVAGGTYPNSPDDIDSRTQLYDQLYSDIGQSITTTQTFSAPTIMPEVNGTDSIYQSTFYYEQSDQWIGFLTKYALNADGSLGSQIWEAGSLLSNVPAATRNIWTVGNSLPNSLNNFTIANEVALYAIVLHSRYP